MTDDRIKLQLIDKADLIVKALKSGKDIEIRKSSNGITIAEVRKTVIHR